MINQLFDGLQADSPRSSLVQNITPPKVVGKRSVSFFHWWDMFVSIKAKHPKSDFKEHSDL